ncbi:unnamed protein product, partial [Hapterophycus canaliculatus]
HHFSEACRGFSSGETRGRKRVGTFISRVFDGRDGWTGLVCKVFLVLCLDWIEVSGVGRIEKTRKMETMPAGIGLVRWARICTQHSFEVFRVACLSGETTGRRRAVKHAAVVT